MSFDDIPENEQASYPCPNCGGNVTQSEHGTWYCDSCAWNSNNAYNGEYNLKRENVIKLAVQAGFTKVVEGDTAFILTDGTNHNITHNLEFFAKLIIEKCEIKAVDAWEEYGADGQEIAAELRNME